MSLLKCPLTYFGMTADKWRASESEIFWLSPRCDRLSGSDGGVKTCRCLERGGQVD